MIVVLIVVFVNKHVLTIDDTFYFNLSVSTTGQICQTHLC